ncbi:MAG: Ig-like domain-containing protein [Leptospirales bacterium]
MWNNKNNIRTLYAIVATIFMFIGCNQAVQVDDSLESSAAEPFILATVPMDGYALQFHNAGAMVAFNKDMVALDLTDPTLGNVLVQDITDPANPVPVIADFSYSDLGKALIIQPVIPTGGGKPVNLNGSTFSVTLLAGNSTNGIRALDGTNLQNDYTFTYTYLAYNTVDARSQDKIAPMVTFKYPVPASVGISTETAITITFNEPVNPALLSGSSLIITDDPVNGTPVSGVLRYVVPANTLMFFPTQKMKNNTVYTATLVPGIRDLTDALQNATATEVSWTFTTEKDKIPPSVLATTPADGSIGVGTNAAVSITMSELINPVTLNNTSITVVDAAQVQVAGIYSFDANSNTINFSPSANLATNMDFTVNVTAGLMDMAGNAATPYAFTFTSGAGIDSIAPTVSATSPLDTATSVSLNASISIQFSEAMDPSTITLFDGISGSVSVLDGVGTPALGNLYYDGPSNSAIFIPSADYNALSAYQITVTSGAAGVKDLSGNSLVADYIVSFTTGNQSDKTAPLVIVTSPVHGTTNMLPDTPISVSFNEPLNASTINNQTFVVSDGATDLAGTVSYIYNAASAINTATFTLQTGVVLDPAKIYTARLSTLIKDLAGNPLTTDYHWSFTVKSTQGSSLISSIFPANGSLAVPVTLGEIQVTFTNSLSPLSQGMLSSYISATVNNLTTGAVTSLTPTSVTYDSLTKKAIITLPPLAGNSIHTFNLAGTITDIYGTTSPTDYSWSMITEKVYYPVSVTATGVSGTGLILQNNGGDNLAINANSTFVFATSVLDNTTYNVTLASNPTMPYQECSLTNASGTINAAGVSNVAVNCVTKPICPTQANIVKTPGVDWTMRTPPTAAITGTGSCLVAVGDWGKVVSSPDGVNWETQKTGLNDHFADITWGGTKFVAVGAMGAVVTVEDGETWVKQNSGLPTNIHLQSIAWTGNLFVAVGSAGTIITSPDGINWTTQNSGTTSELTSVKAFSNIIAAVGGSNILYSIDGVNWQVVNMGLSTTLKDVAWSGSEYMALDASGYIYSSPDGMSWSLVSVLSTSYGGTPVSNDGRLIVKAIEQALVYYSKIEWDGNQFIVLSKAHGLEYFLTTATGYIFTSTDGASWAVKALPTSTAPSDIYIDNSKTYLSDWYGNMLVSYNNAVDWGYAMESFEYSDLKLVEWADGNGLNWLNGEYWMVTDRRMPVLDPNTGGTLYVNSGILLRSVDGIHWHKQVFTPPIASNPFAFQEQYYFRTMRYFNGQYIVTGSIYQNGFTRAMTMVSFDGTTWSAPTAINNVAAFYDIDHSSAELVAVGVDATNHLPYFYTSANGVTWKQSITRQIPGTNLFSVSCSKINLGTDCVAVGRGGAIFWLTGGVGDGISVGAETMTDVVWSNSNIVVVGANGTVYESTDMQNWTGVVLSPNPYSSDGGTYFESITWDGANFIAVGYQTIQTSKDGISWQYQNHVMGTWQYEAFLTVGAKPALSKGEASQYVIFDYNMRLFTSP